jgi:D-lactate dehydrogenase
MAPLQRSPQALAPETAEAAPDRAPDAIAAGVAQPLRGELEALLGPDRVLGRAGGLIKNPYHPTP